MDARRRLAAEEWDVAVLDWWLPGADGLEVLRQYRQSGGTVPILLLTAGDYLCKPFAFEELLARVRALARRADRRVATTLTFDDVTADLSTHRVERAGRRLDLTAKEFALLVFLLRHPGEVLSRTRIYERMWDDHYDGVSNALEVHVMELRKKLEAHGPRLLQTVRGRGYVLSGRKTGNAGTPMGVGEPVAITASAGW